MKKIFLALLYVCVFYTSGLANTPLTFDPELGKLPILSEGRTKPLLVHARATMRTILGKRDRQALQDYVALSTGGSAEALSYSIHNVALQKRLQLKQLRLDVASEGRESIVAVYQQLQSKGQDKGAEGRAIADLVAAIDSYQTVKAGEDWLLPVHHDGKLDWAPIAQVLEVGHFSAAKDIIGFVASQPETQASQSKILLEYYYEVSGVHFLNFFIAIISLGLFFVLVMNPKSSIRPLAWSSLGLVLLLHIGEIIVRVLISGRGPVTNMFETVMWVGLGVMVFSLLLYKVNKNLLYVPAGLTVFALTSMMANFGTHMVNADIHPLVPVLRNNFWLSTHVTCVTISYAAFALSWIIANIAIVSYLINGKDDVFPEAARMSYEANKIGLVLIVTGVILGGIWADYSWGRFWGWDPKETWSLIVTITYSIILHARYMGYMKPNAFVAAQAGAFLTVMMAWFGVNYILATGLHSYGFSQNGAIFLFTFFAVQLGILGVFGWRTRKGA